MFHSKLNSTHLACVLALCALGFVNTVYSADPTNPLSPAFQSPQEESYWKNIVGKMVNQDQLVTKEAYLKHYSDIWDENVPKGRDAVTIDELAKAWADRETKDPLSPEYKSVLWRKDQVATWDTDGDGTVSKPEFMKHMEKRWAEASNKYHQLTTKEAYLKHYADLWDQNVPAGKTATIDEFVNRWAATETRDPLSPEYKSPALRREHVLTIDTDNDGTISREEFLKHMEDVHWAAAQARYKADALTRGQAVELMNVEK
jgi:EF hand/EF-hand domain pair